MAEKPTETIADPHALTRASLGHRELVTIKTPHGEFKVANTPGNMGIIKLYGGGETVGPPASEPADTGNYAPPNAIDTSAMPVSGTYMPGEPVSDSPAPVMAQSPDFPSTMTPPQTGGASGTWEPGGNVPVVGTDPVKVTAPAAPLAAGPISPLQEITKNEDTSRGAQAEAAWQQASRDKAAAISAQSTAEQAAEHLKFQQATDTRRMMQDRQNLAAAQRTQIDSEIKSQTDAFHAATSKLQSMQVDPSQAFGDGASWQKVIAGIGLALGAIGQGLNGQENPAIKIIQSAIQTSVEAQKANMLKQGAVVDATRGGLQTYIQVAHDKQDAFQMETARLNDIVAQKFAAIAASSSDPQIKARAAAAQSQFTEENARALDQVNKRIYSREEIKGAKNQMQEPMPQAAADSIKSKEQGALQATKLANMISSGNMGTGKQYSLNKFAQALGIDDPKVTADAVLLKQAIYERMAEMGRSTPALADMIEKISPTITTNPESAIRIFKNQAAALHTSAKQDRAQTDYKYRQIPLPSGTQYNPASYDADMGFVTQIPGDKARGDFKKK